MVRYVGVINQQRFPVVLRREQCCRRAARLERSPETSIGRRTVLAPTRGLLTADGSDGELESATVRGFLDAAWNACLTVYLFYLSRITPGEPLGLLQPTFTDWIPFQPAKQQRQNIE